jgi:serine phosphatase RsbU (regulator of sigma subunit)
MLTDRRNVSLVHGPARLPLGIFPRYTSADHVVPLGPDALLILYTDGVTEHARDLIRGELELESASRLAFQTQAREAAAFIAAQVLNEVRGSDDAAIVTVRCRSRAG